MPSPPFRIDTFEEELEGILYPIQTYARLLQESDSNCNSDADCVLEVLHKSACESIRVLANDLKEIMDKYEALLECPSQVVMHKGES